MSDTPVLIHVVPARRPGLPGRRLRIIAGLKWMDLPAGREGKTQLNAAAHGKVPATDKTHPTGQWLRMPPAPGSRHRRTGFTREAGHLWSLAVLAIPALRGNGYAFIRNGQAVSFVACVRDIPALVGDITGSPDQVSRACRAFLQLHDRDTPAEGWTVLGSPDAPLDITAVLPERLPRQARLTPVNQGARLATLAILLPALAGLAWWGYGHYSAQQTRLQDEARAFQASLAEQEASPERRRETPPWPTMPSVNTFLGTCLPLLQGLPVILEGWSMTASECRADSLKIEFARKPGSGATLEAFLEKVKTRLPAVTQITLDNSGNKIQLSQPLSMPPGGDESLVHEELHLARFLFPFQYYDRPVSLEKQEDVERLLDIDGQSVTFFQDWYEWTFTLSERRAPDAAVFSWPGTRLTALTVTLSDDAELNWVTEGRTWALKSPTQREPDAEDDIPPAE